jgi:hypothetical protein
VVDSHEPEDTDATLRVVQRALLIAATLVFAGCGSTDDGSACDPKVENGARMSTRGASPVVCVSGTLELALDLWECATAAEVTPWATWSSDKPSVAVVDQGVVRGVAPGNVTITALYAGRSDQTTIQVVGCP